MSSRRPYIIPAFLILLACNQIPSYSQQAVMDTAFLSASKKKIISLYTESIQRQSRLYNGTDYVMYFTRFEEHPYFMIDDWIFGSVVYWDELYENVALMYDLSLDELITEHNRGNPIKLVTQKIESFTISDHTFVRLRRDSSNKITEGFYDRLYNGSSKVYGKYQKHYRETLRDRQIIPSFDENARYYLVRDGVFNTVKTKASILQVFHDHKQEVRNFIRKNRIRFKNNRDVAIVQVAEFYDSLAD